MTFDPHPQHQSSPFSSNLMDIRLMDYTVKKFSKCQEGDTALAVRLFVFKHDSISKIESYSLWSPFPLSPPPAPPPPSFGKASVTVSAHCAVPAVLLPGQARPAEASHMEGRWACIAAQQLSALSTHPALVLDTNLFPHKPCLLFHINLLSAQYACLAQLQLRHVLNTDLLCRGLGGEGSRGGKMPSTAAQGCFGGVDTTS